MSEPQTTRFAFQVSHADLPDLVNRLSLRPGPLSPLAGKGGSPGGATGPDVDAVLAAPRAAEAVRLAALPSARVRIRTGGGTRPLSEAFVCLGEGEGAARVTPSFEAATLLEHFETVEASVASLAADLGTPVDEPGPNFLPPPLPLETLLLAFHTIDAFRRASYESELAHQEAGALFVEAAAFGASLGPALGAADTRWLLPAFAVLTPGIDSHAIAVEERHLERLVTLGLLEPVTEGGTGRGGYRFGEAGQALGIEFQRSWLSAAGLQTEIFSPFGVRAVARAFLAPTAVANHLVDLSGPAGAAAEANHQALSKAALGRRLWDLVEAARAASREAARPAAPPALVGVAGPATGRRFELGTVTRIGRSTDSDVVLDDRAASSRHAEIRQGEAGPELVDLGSTNGTWVGSARVAAARALADGDVITIGASRLRFEARAPGLEATMVIDPPGLG